MVRGDPDFDEMEESDSGSDEEPAPKARGRKQPAAAKPRRAPKRPAGSVNLRILIDEGVLTPAEDVLTVEYKGTITHASLAPDGRIRWKDMFFDSPSAFSIYLKRLVNPARKADDGWKTVKYAGKFLEQYKMELLVRRYGGEGSSGLDGSSTVPPPAKKARTSAAAAAAAADSSGTGAPMLKQLAPRGRGRGGGAAGSSSRGQAAAAGAGASSSVGGAAAGSAAAAGAGNSRLNEHTPRPQDLGSMLAAEHDYAPREGELVGIGDSDEPIIEPGKHFVSGVQLDAMSNGTSSTEYTGDTPYNPPAAAAAAAAAADQQQQQQSEGGTATPPPPGLTAASSRPRRVIRAPERLINSAMAGYGGGERDDHDMVRCDSYAAGSTPGSGAAGAQPFRVQVTPLAEVMMDFHAHLDRHEIIGLLAGSWLPEQRLLRVERAFPVREAIASGAANDGINVEMDPEDQFKVTEVIQELYGLQVVGWYHSHPSFPALPSVIDIANQLQMQQQFRQAPSGDEPYIAAIVSPYDKRLPGLQSSVTWFRVEGKGGAAAAGGGGGGGGGAAAAGLNVLEQGYAPIELSVERLLRQSTPHSLLRLIPALTLTAQRYVTKRSAANLGTAWRPAAAAAAAADGAAGVVVEGLLGTRMGKLLGSVKEWWPRRYNTLLECQQFMDGLKAVLLDVRQAAGLPPLDTDLGGDATSSLAPLPAAAAAPPAAAAAAATLKQQQQQLQSQQLHQPKQPFATSLFKALAGGKSASNAGGSSNAPAGARSKSKTPPPQAAAAAVPAAANAAAVPLAPAPDAAAAVDKQEQEQQQQVEQPHEQLDHQQKQQQQLQQQQQQQGKLDEQSLAVAAAQQVHVDGEEPTDTETEDEADRAAADDAPEAEAAATAGGELPVFGTAAAVAEQGPEGAEGEDDVATEDAEDDG